MYKYCRRSLLLILFASMISSIQAQKKDYSGSYIIYPDGDTIEGWVKDRSSGAFIDLYPRIRFKPEKALFKKKYSPDDILAYSINGQIYESVPLMEESAFFKFSYYVNEGNDRVFLKVISRDAGLTYYHWEYVDEDSNYLDYIPLFYRDGFTEMVRITQGILGLKRNKLISYFSDCPDLGYAIQARELNKIYDVYNFYLDSCVDQ